MRTPFLLLLLAIISGCSTAPMSPEEAAYYQRVGNGLTGLSNQLNQQQSIQQQNQQQSIQQQNQQCQYTPDGFGGFRSSCQNY